MFSGNATNEAKASPDEVTEIGWFTIAEAKKMDLAFRHKEAIQLFLSRRDKHNDL